MTPPAAQGPLSADDIDAARQGDSEALGRVFRRYNAALLRYLRGLGVRHADDIAGQVWLEVSAGFARFTGDDDGLRRWLFTIARRRMIDAYRRECSRPEELVDSPVVQATAPPADASLERLEWAEEILRQLPPQQAEVVLLRTVAGFTVDEVAAMIDKSPGAVRVLAHRGLERVLDLLAQQHQTVLPITSEISPTPVTV